MRRATIRTVHDDPDAIARAVEPDNTDEMTTTVDEALDDRAQSGDADDATEKGAVVTRIQRETTGGLHSTVDDYVVNVDVATRVVQHANRSTDTSASDTTHEP